MASEDVRGQVKAGNVLLINSEERRVEVEGAKDLCMDRRRMGKFVRKFALPEKANTGKITTVSRDGVLTVTVEKLPPIEAKLEQLRSHGDERKQRIGAVDRLSMLPDELLLCILSLLSFKEATATSILCRRWRHLHTFTSKLDFDGIKISQKSFHMKPKDFEVLRQKFHSWVDGVVRLNQSSRLEKFSVRFYLRGGFFHTDDIDEWVRFALSKKVESLELFSPWASLAAFEKYYTLNFHKWDYDFNFMKKLVTHSVDVSGEAVEMLLRKCPLLEQVSIADSKQLLFLEIIKPFPAFRSLEILECMNLSSVLVDDSNIVSFKYHGNMVDKVVLVNVPLLTELWISGRCTKYAMGVLDMFSCVLPQLHTLKICINWTLRDFCIWFCTFVEMSNLKQLVVNTGDINFKEDLLPLANLVRALPGLQRFVIEEPYEKNRADDVVDVEVKPIEIADARSVDRILFRANTELKEVEFVGYLGVRGHFGLLRHLVENVDALETIVIDPWGFKKPDYAATFEQIPRRKYDHEIFARANALKHLVPSRINVRVLGLEH